MAVPFSFLESWKETASVTYPRNRKARHAAYLNFPDVGNSADSVTFQFKVPDAPGHGQPPVDHSPSDIVDHNLSSRLLDATLNKRESVMQRR